MTDELKKTCKIHGELTPDLIQSLVNKRGYPFTRCRLCERERNKRYRIQNREKIRERERQYWENNKEAIKEKRILNNHMTSTDCYHANPKKYREHYRAVQKKYRDELHDSYVKKCLQDGNKELKFDDFSPDMVELKRSVMQLKRETKKTKK